MNPLSSSPRHISWTTALAFVFSRFGLCMDKAFIARYFLRLRARVGLNPRLRVTAHRLEQ